MNDKDKIIKLLEEKVERLEKELMEARMQPVVVPMNPVYPGYPVNPAYPVSPYPSPWSPVYTWPPVVTCTVDGTMRN